VVVVAQVHPLDEPLIVEVLKRVVRKIKIVLPLRCLSAAV
jgi:hypothetical protein